MLLAELVVVFLGVYGAFWVDNYREQQDRDERTRQVILVLQQDLEDFIQVSGSFNRDIEAGLTQWKQGSDNGTKPAPYVFRIYGAERPPQSTWNTVRQAQLSGLLHPNLLYELGFYYNELDGFGEKIVSYSRFTDAVVMPQLKSGNTGFYTADGSTLKPEFEAHMDRLRELHRLQNDLVVWAGCQLTRLESADKATPACRTQVGVTVLPG